MKYINRLLFLVFVAAIIVFAFTFYYQTQIVENKALSSAAFKDPLQTQLQDSNEIAFKKNGYDYKLTPLFDYKITGLVVSKTDYDPPVDSARRIVRFDLCMVWGKNLSNKIYLSRDIDFSQNGRFCTIQGSSAANFTNLDINSWSNNHLIVTDDKLIEKLKSINRSDEVVVTGKLVKMVAVNSGNGEDTGLTWNSSTTREDTGGGACEVIYVSAIDIVSSPHKSTVQANQLSVTAITYLFGFFVVELLFFLVFKRARRPPERSTLR